MSLPSNRFRPPPPLCMDGGPRCSLGSNDRNRPHERRRNWTSHWSSTWPASLSGAGNSSYASQACPGTVPDLNSSSGWEAFPYQGQTVPPTPKPAGTHTGGPTDADCRPEAAGQQRS